MPRVPLTFEDLVETVSSRHAKPLGGVRGFDEGRAGVPRAHEHALWTQLERDAEVSKLAQLLRQKQTSLPWEQIVRLSRDPVGSTPRKYRRARPIQVRCKRCKVERNFDWCFGSFHRLKLAAERTNAATSNDDAQRGSGCRGVPYLPSPSIQSFLNETTPQLISKLEDPDEVCFDVDWEECTNCEASRTFEERRFTAPAEQQACSERLGLQKQLLEAAVTLEVAVPLETLSSIPCAFGESLAMLDCPPAKLGVLMVQREMAERALARKAESNTLVGAPSVRGLFADAAGAIGDEMSTRAAAGGAEVDTALVIIMPAAKMNQIMGSDASLRASTFKATTRDPTSGCEALAIATLDGHLPRAESVNAETATFYAARDAEKLNNRDEDGQATGKTESGRPGAVRSWTALIDQPDLVRMLRMRSIPGGEDHVRHTLVVVHPGGKDSRVLVIHPSGPDGQAPPFFNQAARKLDGEKTAAYDQAKSRATQKRKRDEEQRVHDGRERSSFYFRLEEFATPEDRELLEQRRLCYGQPRFFVACAGRPFRDASLDQNRDLQMQNGPFAEHHRRVASCGVMHMLALAALGLAPGPREDVADWEAARQVPLLGRGVALTAQYTWFSFWIHRSRELAIMALACCQGYYENPYAAFLHADASDYMESWVLRREERHRQWAEQHGLHVAATQVPQLSLELRADPNRTVWTAFLQELLHAATDPPLRPRPEGWEPSRGAGEVFALQARGSIAYNGVAYWQWEFAGKPVAWTGQGPRSSRGGVSGGTRSR